MALLFLDGFDNIGNSTQMGVKGWSNPGGTFPVGRSGTGQSWQNVNTSTVISKSFATNTTVITGFAFKQVSAVASDQVYLRVGATLTMALRINASNHIEIRNSTPTLIATGTATLNPGTFYYIEIKLVINGASGTVEVHVNGATDIASTTGNFGSTGIDNWGALGRTQGMVIDDLYVFNGSGGVNDGFVGDVRVQTLYPNGAGNSTQWTPNGAASNYLCVNEAIPDDDTTYVSDSTVGHIDQYTLDDVDGGASVKCAQTNVYARKDDGSTRQVAPIWRQSSTDYVGSTVTLTSSYSFYLQQYDTDPSGAAWTPSALNGDQLGVKEIA